MKTFKRGLFWAVSICLTLPIIVLGAVATVFSIIFAFIAATIEVVDTLFSRFEHWAYDVPKGSFINCPYKYTLREVWIRAYNGEYS